MADYNIIIQEPVSQVVIVSETPAAIINIIEEVQETLITIATGEGGDLTTIQTQLNGKQDKEAGKGLSTEDYTTSEKTKLAGIATGAEVNVNADWNASSGDGQILNKPIIPDELSDLTQDATHRIVTDAEKIIWNAKQDAIGFTPENPTNKVGAISGASSVQYPNVSAVIDYVAANVSSAIVLQGDWNANTNTPDISGTTISGKAWRVSVAGSFNLGGITSWAIGDLAVKSAAGWVRISAADVSAVWGNITGTLSNQSDLQTALNAKLTKNTPIAPATFPKIQFDANGLVLAGYYLVAGDIPNIAENQVTNLTTDLANKVDKNSAITGATKTKVTYDAKGLVTAGADATTADIAASANKNYVTDAQQTVLTNTSGTNTGDQTFTPAAGGDVTGGASGNPLAPTLNIGANKVTNAKLAAMPALSMKGNDQVSAANAADLSVAAARTLLAVNNTDNTSDVNKPTSTAQQASINSAATTAENNAKTYADGLVIGLLDDRGNYDASTNVFPSTGGSGAAGAVLKGDLWTVSVGGTLGGVAVTPGDLVRALVNAPGQTAGNWAVSETNIGYVAENIVNKSTDGTFAANSDTFYPSQKASKTYADTKVPQTRTVNGKALSANITITKADVGLTSADDTSDVNKPISTAQQTALNAKQVNIQIQDEGVNQGASGTADTVNFTGAGVTASRAGNLVTVSIPGGAGANIASSLRVAATDEVIAANYGAIITGFYRLPSPRKLTINANGALKIS